MIRVILTLLITSCGVDPQEKIETIILDHILPIDIDSRFQDVIYDFRDDAEFYAVDINSLHKLRTARFTSLPNKSLGRCYTSTVPNNNHVLIYSELFIDRHFKEQLDSYRFRTVVYHELGHCLLRKRHSIGIMSRQIPKEYYLKLYWNRLVRHLFTGEEI